MGRSKQLAGSSQQEQPQPFPPGRTSKVEESPVSPTSPETTGSKLHADSLIVLRKFFELLDLWDRDGNGD